MTLPIGYHIVGRFEILEVIAIGGFGIAYWAYDKNFHREVCIKELFIPKSQRLADYSVQTASINDYDGSYFIKNFLSEARKVANVRHENIVEVRDVFEANGTAYIVMEYVKGISLSDKIKREGPLNPVTAVSLFRTLGDAVQKLHSISLIHRDIKPDNILVEAETGRIVLIDFGNAKEMHSGTDSFVYLSNGYSAIEQYSKEAKKTFATDIYSIGATMYFALTGNQPITAVDRISSDGLTPPNAFNPSIENYISNAILRAMSVQVENRYQNVVDFKNAISCPPTEIEPENTYVVTDNNPVYKENNQKKVIIGISLALVFLAILVYITNKTDDKKEKIQYVLIGEINLRTKPLESSQSLLKISQGDSLIISDKETISNENEFNHKWVKCKYKKKEGWVALETDGQKNLGSKNLAKDFKILMANDPIGKYEYHYLRTNVYRSLIDFLKEKGVNRKYQFAQNQYNYKFKTVQKFNFRNNNRVYDCRILLNPINEYDYPLYVVLKLEYGENKIFVKEVYGWKMIKKVKYFKVYNDNYVDLYDVNEKYIGTHSEGEIEKL